MKINIIGSGTMGSEIRGCQSILVDNILFDIGAGITNKICQLGLHPGNVKYLVITHSHADHFVDLPVFLIGRGIRGENNNLLNII